MLVFIRNPQAVLLLAAGRGAKSDRLLGARLMAGSVFAAAGCSSRKRMPEQDDRRARDSGLGDARQLSQRKRDAPGLRTDTA